MAESCIIIPCYNEAKRISLQSFVKFQNFNKNIFDFYFVDDGSIDNTNSILQELCKNSTNFHLISIKNNIGKAEAIRYAVISIDKAYKKIGYLDADLSTTLNEYFRLYQVTLNSDKSFIMGSRVKLIGSKIKRRLKRHISGRFIATCIDSFILKLGIYDTQCGAKIINYSLAKEIFKQPFKSKWLFDVELILRIKNKYGKLYCLNHIIEIPLISWNDDGKSKITFIDILKLPFNFLKIYFHYR